MMRMKPDFSNVNSKFCTNTFFVALMCFFICNSSAGRKVGLHNAIREGILNDIELEKLINGSSNYELNAKNSEGQSPLFLAALVGNKRAFDLIDSRGAEGNITNKYGQSLLHVATIGGDLDIINKILEVYEISISFQDNHGNTVMHYVALGIPKKNNIEVCEILLEEGASLGIKNNDNKTPFHLAVENDLPEILELMLKTSGSTWRSIRMQDANGNTALQIALDKNLTQIFALFINYSVSPFERDYDGRTVIHNAILKGDTDSIKVALLSGKTFRGEANRIISYQEGLGYKDILNYTALHLAVEKGFDDVVDVILSFKKCKKPCKGLIIKTVNYYNDTLLHGAVKGGKHSILKKILNELQRKDNYLDKQNKDGHTALHLAVQEGNENMIELLLMKRANAFIKDYHDFYPLGLAASYGTLDVLRLFKTYKLTIDPQYNATELLAFALANGNDQNVIDELLSEISKYFQPTFLIPAKAQNDDIHTICETTCPIKTGNCDKNTEEQKKVVSIMRTITADHEKFITELAEEEKDESSARYEHKPTLLNYALFFNGNLKTLKNIIQCKPQNESICEMCEINEAWSPIDIAAFRGKIDIVKYLVTICKEKCKQDLITMKDEQEQSVVHKAAWGGQCEILHYLYNENKRTINDVDKWERTPLHVAASRGYKRAIECILNISMSSLNKKDKYEFTPLHLAEIYGHHKFFTLLQQTSITLDPEVRYQMKYPGTKNRLRNHIDVIRLLLEKGADPNAQDATLGWTTLHWAAANGDIEVVKMLLNNKIKARVNLPSKNDQTPMYLARFWGRTDVYKHLKLYNSVW